MPNELSSLPARRRRAAAMTIVLGGFLVMQVYLVFIVRHENLDLDVFPNTVPAPDFYGTTPIGQTFVAEGSNIARIDMLFGTHDRKASFKIGLELFYTDTAGALAATSEIQAAAVRNNLYNEFRFPVVRHTRGLTFLIRLTAPAATAEDSYAVWKNDADIYPRGTMLYNGAPDPGDLIFRVYSRQTIASELGEVVRKNPGILGSPIFFALVVLFLEASLIWTLWSIVDRIFPRRGGHA